MDPFINMSSHNEVKAVHRDFDFIYADDSVLNEKTAAVAIIDNCSSIECLPNESTKYSAELYTIYLALDRIEMADYDEMNFVIFSHSKFAL